MNMEACNEPTPNHLKEFTMGLDQEFWNKATPSNLESWVALTRGKRIVVFAVREVLRPIRFTMYLRGCIPKMHPCQHESFGFDDIYKEATTYDLLMVKCILYTWIEELKEDPKYVNIRDNYRQRAY
jgi:hypothetical protein